ncbi:FkbM family methyltransferase [Enterovirga aerilata]|uniref:FkbM family methyltransferase n=1 Tax=Enterovirga aerilata TaxID=2730920 RepID=A0A849IFE7_9HYPH|nr:FkbM family methyltransferase [Enterovirga sp. DB1703]NNM72623.1 FkbM family methyltransferase [Enterovirga sp. DB1703]
MIEAASYGAYAPKGIVRFLIDWTRSLPDTWLARRAVILVRRFVMRRLDGAPVDIEAWGVRMRVRPYNNICEKRVLFTPQTFDAAELAILAADIREGYVFIDVGANVGAYSLFVASRAGPSARILAVEPQPEIYDRLTFNIRLNAFPTIKAIDCAVAEKTGEVTLFLDPNNAGESSLKVVSCGGATPIRVAARTLLDLIQGEGYERVDAIKLDVEGAEDLIIEPYLAKAPSRLFPRLLILENGLARWQIDLARLLENKGYVLKAKTRQNLVFERACGETLDG